MVSQQPLDVVFQNQFGMYLGPVVGGTNKRKQKLGVLQRLPIKDTFEGTERSRRIGSSQEDMRGARKDCLFLRAVRLRGKSPRPSPSHKARCGSRSELKGRSPRSNGNTSSTDCGRHCGSPAGRPRPTKNPRCLAIQYRTSQKRDKETNNLSFRREGNGLSRYANWANPHRFSVIFGSSVVSRKKFGRTPNRAATLDSRSVFIVRRLRRSLFPQPSQRPIPDYLRLRRGADTST